jgi:hypothetical protein
MARTIEGSRTSCFTSVAIDRRVWHPAGWEWSSKEDIYEAPRVPPDLRHGGRGRRWRPLLRAEGLEARGEGRGPPRPFFLPLFTN